MTKSYQHEREDFLLAMQAEGMPPEIARRILRHANTVQRLAVAQCNGDYPCDNGQRKVIECPKCGSYVVPENIKGGKCQDCRAREAIEKLCAHESVAAGFSPVFQGDPRGCCVKLRVPSGKTDDWGREGMCGPTHRY